MTARFDPRTWLDRLAAAPDLDTALEHFVAAVGRVAPVDCVAFGVIDDDGTACEVRATAGSSAPRLPVGSFLTLDRDVVVALGRGCAWVVQDTGKGRDLAAVVEISRGGLRSFVSVPVVVGGRPTVLVTFGSVRSRAFGPDAVDAITAAVDPVGPMLHVLAQLDKEREVSRRMRDLDNLRSDFVGMVAHDLRAPVTVISGFAEGLDRGWDVLDDEQKRDFIVRIRHNVTDLNDLVEDVLTVSNLESREFHLDIRPLDLGAHVRQCVAELAESTPDREIVAEIAEDLPPVHADARRQRQVISNLVANALKFSSADAPVTVGARAVGGAVEVRVADRGTGIADADLPHLFRRFYRTAESRSSDRSGTGLGLFICKSLVESWGGEIRVESQVGRGSVFTYTTPLAVADDLTAMPSHRAELSAVSGDGPR